MLNTSVLNSVGHFNSSVPIKVRLKFGELTLIIHVLVYSNSSRLLLHNFTINCASFVRFAPGPTALLWLHHRRKIKLYNATHYMYPTTRTLHRHWS